MLHFKRQVGIVFSASLNGNQEIYRIQSPVFKPIDRLTFTPNDAEQDLKISRNGRRILFSVFSSQYLAWNTYALDLKTKAITDLSNPNLELRNIVALGWSFDESQALLSELNTRKTYLVNPDTRSVKELNLPTSGVSPVNELSYSPDGKKILYEVFDKDANPILTSFLYDLETKEKTQLGSPKAECSHPEWSPSGKQILLYCDLAPGQLSRNNHVYVLDVVGNNSVVREAADLPCGEQFEWGSWAKFAWSPDGKHLIAAYCKMNDSTRSLFALILMGA